MKSEMLRSLNNNPVGKRLSRNKRSAIATEANSCQRVKPKNLGFSYEKKRVKRFHEKQLTLANRNQTHASLDVT